MKFENDKKKYLLVACILLSVVSVSSFYWRGVEVESLVTLVLMWFVPPVLGLLQVYRYSQGEYVNIGVIKAEPEEKDKQKAIVCGAIILIIFPLLVGIGTQ